VGGASVRSGHLAAGGRASGGGVAAFGVAGSGTSAGFVGPIGGSFASSSGGGGSASSGSGAGSAAQRNADRSMQKVLRELVPRILRSKSFERTSIKDVREEAEDRLGLQRGGLDQHRDVLKLIITDYVSDRQDVGSPSGPPTKRQRVDLAEASLAGWREMWESRRFTDAIITCQGQRFEVHRVVLGSRSPVLAAMFGQEGMREGSERHIEVRDSEPEMVEAMLRYMYIGEVRESMDCTQLLRLADEYEVQGLLEVCAEAILEDLSAETVANSAFALRMHRHREVIADAYDRLVDNVQHDKELLRAALESCRP